MIRRAILVGSTLLIGDHALRITQRVESSPAWRTPGWWGIKVPLTEVRDKAREFEFLPDHLARFCDHVPFEWSVLPEGEVEERYAWNQSWTYLRREVRRVEVAG